MSSGGSEPDAAVPGGSWALPALLLALFLAALELLAFCDDFRRASPLRRGADLATYYFAASIALDHRGDPYDNGRWRALHQAGRLAFAHPNAGSRELPMVNIPAGPALPTAGCSGEFGFVASPAALLPFAVLRRAPFWLVSLSWPLAALLLLGAATVAWARACQPSRGGGLDLAAGALLLFGALYWPVRASALYYGQIESLYVPLMLAPLLLTAAGKTQRAHAAAGGACLAAASAIKVFPLALCLAFLPGAIAEWRSDAPDHRRPQSRTIAFTLLFLAVYLLATALLFGPRIYHAWYEKVIVCRALTPKAPVVEPSLWRHLVVHLPRGAAAVALGGAALVLALLLRELLARHRGPDHPLLDRASLVLAALPSLMPHWWFIYNTVLAFPFIYAAGLLARRWREGRPRWVLAGALALAVAYLLVGFSGYFSHLLEAHQLSPARAALLSPLLGYPGSALLFVAIVAIRRRAAAPLSSDA
jgi:hypothetical protein